MMSWSSSVTPLVTPSKLHICTSPIYASPSSISDVGFPLRLSRRICSSPIGIRYHPSALPSLSSKSQICRARAAAEYKFPDPIPDFADAEVEEFRTHLLNKLSKREMYEDSVEEVVEICTDIFSNFLHTEYGGPGTLLVEPFIDMSDALNEQGLPGGPQAARAAIKWATKHVDKDWKEWTGDEN